MFRRVTLIATLLAIAVLVAACGGGSNDSATTALGDPDETVEVIAVDPFAYLPNRVEVKRGSVVEIVLKNEGTVGHDLHIDDFKVATELVAAGQQTSIKFNANKVGEYKMYCAEPGHDIGGMNGTLVVTN